MKNILILTAVVAAIAGIIALKKSGTFHGASKACPCSVAEQSVTNQVDSGSVDAE